MVLFSYLLFLGYNLIVNKIEERKIKMSDFSLTLKQLKNIVKEAESNDNMEDILKFKVENGRLVISQYDWGHTETNVIMNKPR
jgi:hypothetical protein